MPHPSMFVPHPLGRFPHLLGAIRLMAHFSMTFNNSLETERAKNLPYNESPEISHESKAVW